MRVHLGSIAKAYGMVFEVDVDDGHATSYQFLIALPPNEGSRMERSFKVSEHDNIHEAIAWLNGYVYALEGHAIGKPRIIGDPRPESPRS